MMLEDPGPKDSEGRRDLPAGAETAAVVQHGLTSGQLSRGCVVLRGDMLWACLFDVDRYWFAVPIQRVLNLTPTGARKWLGNTEEMKSNHRDIRHAVAAMRRATPTQEVRDLLQHNVPTGVIAVEVLAPIGQGQSMLICGPRGTGKSSLMRDIIESALLSNRFGSVVRYTTDLVNPLVDAPVYRAKTFLDVCPSPADDRLAKAPPAPALVRDLFIAIAAAENVRDSTENVFIVLDTLVPLLETWFLGVAWAEEQRGSALDRELLGVQRRALFASVLARAAALKGGQGSLTILAGVETDVLNAAGEVESAAAAEPDEDTVFELSDFEGEKKSDLQRLKRLTDRGLMLTMKTLKKVGIRPPPNAKRSADFPEDQERMAVRQLQSLSDGQIVLSPTAAAAGDLPAVLPNASFSRLGLGSAEGASTRRNHDMRPPAFQVVAASLRMEISSITAERMDAVRAVLLQPERTPLLDAEMTALLLAASGGVLDKLDADKTKTALRGGSDSPLVRFLHEANPDILRKLKNESADSKISDSTVRELDGALRLFMALDEPHVKGLPPGASWYLPGSSLDIEGVLELKEKGSMKV